MSERAQDGKSRVPFVIEKGSPLPLGVTVTGSRMNFSVYTADANCRLLLYKKSRIEGYGKRGPEVCVSEKADHSEGMPLHEKKKGAGSKEEGIAGSLPAPDHVIPAEAGKRRGSIWYVALTGLDTDRYVYQFEIGGRRTPGAYAAAIYGHPAFGRRMQEKYLFGAARCGDDFDWGEDAPLGIPAQEIVAYALHVRGFTKDRTSGVKHKGTFAGVAEKLPYLQALGINQIELMPAYEYPEMTSLDDSHEGTGSRMNYWGYGPAFYFAPKASFAADADPCAEFKRMVKACHSAGIEVVMEFYFPEGTNGNLILDCLRHWSSTYHVDGFHLGGSCLPMPEIVNDPLLSLCKLYAYGFPEGCLQADGGMLTGLGISSGGRRPESGAGKETENTERLALYQDWFQQTARRLLKSDEDQLQPFLSCTMAHPDNSNIINYIAGHNGFTLHDLVSYDVKHNEANGEDNRDGSQYNYSWNCGEEGPTRKKKVLELRKRQMKNALAMLYLSQGIPMLMAGDECGNSQQGNNNAYCQDNPISWVQWNRTGYEQIRTFCIKLIALRKKHPMLHRAKPVRYMDVYGCGFPDVSFHSEKAWFAQTEAYRRHIGILFCDGTRTGAKYTYDILYVAYNFHWISHEFALPKLPDGMEWVVLLDTGAAEADNTADAADAACAADQRILAVPGRTVAVLAGRYK